MPAVRANPVAMGAMALCSISMVVWTCTITKKRVRNISIRMALPGVNFPATVVTPWSMTAVVALKEFW